jgi:hypothetical protein
LQKHHRRFFLLCVEVKFILRVYLENKRTPSLCTLDALDRSTIPSKVEGFFEKRQTRHCAPRTPGNAEVRADSEWLLWIAMRGEGDWRIGGWFVGELGCQVSRV